MKTIFGLLAALLLVSPALAGDPAVGTGGEGYASSGAWVVMDGDIYFCYVWCGQAHDNNIYIPSLTTKDEGDVLCKKARRDE